MLNRLIDFSIDKRQWIAGLFLAATVVGAIGLWHLPVDAVPDITNVQVMVNTKTGALEPERIELQVTYPIETEFMSLPQIEEVRSLSKYGLSQVIAVFKEGTDIYWARQQVSEKLQTARGALPTGLNPELAPMSTGLGEVFMYEVVADPSGPLAKLPEKDRLIQLRTIQEYIVRPYLRRTRGVADVDSNGGYKKQIHINLFPDKLERTGLTIDQVVERMETFGERIGGGYIQHDGKQIIVRTNSGAPTLKQLAQVVLGLDVRGRNIRIEDIADVRIDHSLRTGSATSGGKETVLGTVLMRTGSNSREVASLSEQALREVHLPEGVLARPLYSRGFLVDKTIQTVSKNLLEGAVLVILVLFIFLGEFRPAALVAMAIPISLAIAARGMEWLGISANLMSLGAIDFGLVVDGSVVLIENAVRRLQERTGDSITAVREAAKEVAGPVLFGVFTILLVYVPILSLEGVEGKLFRPMALTVILVLAASLVTALTLMPALAASFLAHAPKPRETSRSLSGKAEKLYTRWLQTALTRPLAVSSTVFVLLGAAFVVASRLGSDFMPSLDEGDLVLNISRRQDISLDRATELQTQAEKTLLTFPEVDQVFSRLGTPDSATDPMGPNLADTFIILKKDQPTSRSKPELYRAVRTALLQKEPDVQISPTQPIQMRFNEILEGSRADVSLRIFGPDLAELMTLITSAETALRGLPGLVAISQDPLTALQRSPVLSIGLNLEHLNRYGATLRGVNQAVETTLAGRDLGSYIDGPRRFPIVLHLDEKLRDDPSVLNDLPIGLAAGGTIPLRKLASMEYQEQVTTIARAWGKRYAALAMQVGGRDLKGFVNEASERLQKALTLPPDIELVWAGQFKNLERAKQRLMWIVPLTLLGVLVLLAQAFGSVPHALVVFVTVPLAGLGGVFSLWMRGLSLSVAASVGFIALIGIAVLNGTVMLTRIQQLQRAGLGVMESVVEGARTRFRPVMMTALVAILGFIPMALNHGIGAEVQRPLATVVIGGLFTSTALTLFVLPLLALRLRRV